MYILIEQQYSPYGSPCTQGYGGGSSVGEGARTTLEHYQGILNPQMLT